MFSILAALITLGGFVNAQGYISLPFTKESVDLSANSYLQKREVTGELEHELTKFAVSFSLGDGQSQKAILNTTYPDIWVYSNQTPARFRYNPTNAEPVSDNLNLNFPDGTRAQGSYYKDKVTFNGVTVDGTFAVSNTYDDRTSFGQFGLGPRAKRDECSDVGQAETSYPYILKEAGKVEAAAYSMRLTQRGKNGNIVFGAVDASQYEGKLQLLDNKAEDTFSVEFTVDGNTLVGEINAASSDMYLPDDIVTRLATSSGATLSEDGKDYILNKWNENLELTLNFSGTDINISAAWLQVSSTQFSSPLELTVKPTSQSNGKVILGEPFLQAAYTVFDLEHNQVAVAQAVRSDNPDYKVITSAGIPGASY
nr:aspartic protease-like protein GME2461 [Starmerella bombicola]